MSTPAGRSLAPRPPEKGVFPLDHFNECKQVCVCGKRERERAIWGWLEKSAAPLPPPPPSPTLSAPSHHLSAQVKDAYMACLSSHAADAAPCSALAKAYLTCRMDR
jgi:hypothetical protein